LELQEIISLWFFFLASIIKASQFLISEVNMIVSKLAPAIQAKASVRGQIQEISLESYRGKWVILLFYPLDFTFVCPTELIAFSESAAEFKKYDTELLGISVDSVYSHLAWDRMSRKEGGLGGLHFPLVEDLNKEISKAYDVLLADGTALRGLFIIDDKGVVQAANINNLDVGRGVMEALRLVQAYQHAAKHGTVCPANWQPGSQDMHADPQKSKEYFNAVN
jgi:alkyl hydroperoxide reductase subunit AhpC